MLRLLYARECGHEADILDDVLHARWTRLQPDNSRRICLPGGNTGLCAIDIDKPTGVLVLAGGRNDLNPVSPTEGSLALFRYPTLESKPDSGPLVVAQPEAVATSFISAVQWFPNDSAIFVTGAELKRNVDVWDTEQFVIATSFHIDGGWRGNRDNNGGDEGGVCTVSASSHPAGRAELFAVACTDVTHVTLVDLDAGTSAHVLQPDYAAVPIHDVVWSPTNPHLLASVDAAGCVSLFDVRRSGAVACLLSMNDRSPPLPQPDNASPLPIRSRSTCRKRRRDGRSNPTAANRSDTLGLSCAWRGLTDFRHGSMRVAPHAIVDISDAPLARVRFTPDGSTLVTRHATKGFLTHDVLTGRLISSFRGCVASESVGKPSVAFEIARDGDHIILGNNGALCCVDVRDGGLVHVSRKGRHMTDLGDFALHPLEEEVLAINSNGLTCWRDIDSK